MAVFCTHYSFKKSLCLCAFFTVLSWCLEIRLLVWRLFSTFPSCPAIYVLLFLRSAYHDGRATPGRVLKVEANLLCRRQIPGTSKLLFSLTSVSFHISVVKKMPFLAPDYANRKENVSSGCSQCCTQCVTTSHDGEKKQILELKECINTLCKIYCQTQSLNCFPTQPKLLMAQRLAQFQLLLYSSLCVCYISS